MHYLFTVTFISPKGDADHGYRKFLNGIHTASGLPGVRVAFHSLCPMHTDEPPAMDDILERVKHSIGLSTWDQEPIMLNVFAVVDVDPIDGSLNAIKQALVSDMTSETNDETPHNVTWVPLEDCSERNNYEKLSTDRGGRL